MTKISALTAVSTAAASDTLPVVQGGVTKKATIQDYIDDGILAEPGGGAVESVNGQTGAVVLDAGDVGADAAGAAAAAQAAAIAASDPVGSAAARVAKTGDTMTGALVTAPASEPAIQFKYTPAYTPSKAWFWRFGTPTTNAGDGSRKDNTYKWGYNAAVDGGREVTGEHAIYIQMEDYYAPTASDRVGEYHLNYTSADGTFSGRPFHIQIRLGTDGTNPNTFEHLYQGRTFAWSAMNNTYTPFQITTGGTAGTTSIYFRGPTIVSDSQSFTMFGGDFIVSSPSNLKTMKISLDNGGNTSFAAQTATTNLQFANWQYVALPGVTMYPSTWDMSVGVTYAEGKNIAFGTTTGTKLGATNLQKIGHWGSTPIVQPIMATGAGHTVDDLITMLQSEGLCRQS